MSIDRILVRRRGTGDIVSGTLLYVFLVVIFTLGVFAIIIDRQNNAAQWEEFYAKEFALLLNQAKPGDQYTIDIQKASEIAVRNGVRDPRYIIEFDGKTREVIVRLREQGETRFSYFTNVVVTDVRMEIGTPGNTLHFTVVKPVEERA